MSNSTSNIAWGQIIIAALVTALLSLIVGVLLHHYTSESADLVYEVFPPAHFDKQATQISIYNARVENAGSKEAEEVQVYLELPPGCNIQDMKVEPSLKSIRYTIAAPKDLNFREVSFPRLNPDENCRFSVLAEHSQGAIIKIEVRGKGLIGHAGRKEKAASFSSLLAFAVVHVGVLLAMISVIFSKRESELRIGAIFDSQKRLLDREIQLVRTQRSGLAEEDLKQLLLTTKFRLFFNPQVPGLSKTKIVRFGEDGKVIEGRNRNEDSWRINKDHLEFLNAKGQVYIRFYYSPGDGRFYHTNDPDTLSLRDQYMTPEQ